MQKIAFESMYQQNVPPDYYIRATHKSVVVVLSTFNTNCILNSMNMYYMYMYMHMQLTELHSTLDKSNKHSNVC